MLQDPLLVNTPASSISSLTDRHLNAFSQIAITCNTDSYFFIANSSCTLLSISGIFLYLLCQKRLRLCIFPPPYRRFSGDHVLRLHFVFTTLPLHSHKSPFCILSHFDVTFKPFIMFFQCQKPFLNISLNKTNGNILMKCDPFFRINGCRLPQNHLTL